MIKLITAQIYLLGYQNGKKAAHTASVCRLFLLQKKGVTGKTGKFCRSYWMLSHLMNGGNNNIILPDPGKRQAAELEGPAA